MARRSGLGRGLGALIPHGHHGRQPGTGLREVPVGVDRARTRTSRGRYFDEEALASLTASVRGARRAPAGPRARGRRRAATS